MAADWCVYTWWKSGGMTTRRFHSKYRAEKAAYQLKKDFKYSISRTRVEYSPRTHYGDPAPWGDE